MTTYIPILGRRAGAPVKRREEKRRELTRIFDRRYPRHRKATR